MLPRPLVRESTSPMSQDATSDRWPSTRDLTYLGLLALVPVLGYRFGIGNQIEQFALVERVLQSDFIPADFYVNSSSGFGPRFYHVRAVAALADVVSLPWAVLLLSVATNFAVALVTFMGSRRVLGASSVAAATAATLVVVNPGFSLGLAGFLRFDSFQPASVAIPLALGGLALIASHTRLYLAAALLAAASAFHPLIGAETAAVAFAAACLFRPTGAAVMRVVPPALLCASLMVLLWALPPLVLEHSAGAVPAGVVYDVMARFRAPHHYLASAMPTAHYATFAVFLGGVVAIAVARFRRHGVEPPVVRLGLVAFMVVVVAMASAYFVDRMRDELWVMAQPFRLLFLVKWIGFLIISAFAAEAFGKSRATKWLLIIAVVLAPADSLGLIALSGALAAWWWPQRALAWGTIGIALVGLALAAWSGSFGSERNLVRSMVAAATLFLVYHGVRNGLRWASLLIAGLLGLAVWNGPDGPIPVEAMRPAFTWSQVSGPGADAARWAGKHSPPGSVWLVPPDMETFRLLARRAIIVDFTSVPLDPAGLQAWRDRIETAYGPVSSGGFDGLRTMRENYGGRTEEELRRAASHLGATHAVLPLAVAWPGTSVVYRNAEFQLVQF